MNEANQLRLVAAEIIHRLWRMGEDTQLELLEMQARRSREEPYNPEVHDTWLPPAGARHD